MSNAAERERDFTSGLITILSLLNTLPTREEIIERATRLSEEYEYKGSLDVPIEEAMTAINTSMGEGTSLIDTETEHNYEWVSNIGISWAYAESYEKYLKRLKWSVPVVRTLGDVNTKILGHLQNPKDEGAWDRRGLVIGHVQSGKTASYIGLINKAADTGYKFIIVIAGIQNDLRKQTQERIDEGFIGRSSNPGDNKIIGVGINDRNYQHPVTLTNIDKDFNKMTADQSGWKINDFRKPVILIIKKNVSILRRLYNWLESLNATQKGEIADVPMLMIDDEADHASINTNKPNLDPTKTNAMLRRILKLFSKSCYVGYTATPFANIFINPDDYDEEARKELFPKDFIYCLDEPTTYFGPDKVFLNEESSDKILRCINDAENYIPSKHKRDYEVLGLPPSLYESIRCFILARAIRNLRGYHTRHCSMMINVSRFISIQNDICSYVSDYIDQMRKAVAPDNIDPEIQYKEDLRETFLQEFNNCGFNWQNISKVLPDVLDHIHIFVVNSRSEYKMDFKKYEKEGKGLTAIAIGGLSLSRGLTIEGLCTSYVYRNTRMYDTLMQMGRWFGYRSNYEDLCRIYLSLDSINWYSHISEASEELRLQIKQMRRNKLSPEKFGLYVRAHPDTLLITAPNKMRSGEKVTVKQNYAGKIRESYFLPNDAEINSFNLELIQEYWEAGFDKGFDAIDSTEKGWYIPDVNSETIRKFLMLFRTTESFIEQRNAFVDYLESISSEYPCGDVLIISPNTNNTRKEQTLNINSQKRTGVYDKEGNCWLPGKYRVASRGDEKLGLTREQVDEAENDYTDTGKTSPDFAYRKVRNKPLLMLHIIDVEPSNKNNRNESVKNVPAFGMSFPDGDYTQGIEVLANKVWINAHGAWSNTPDEYDDY